MSNEREQALDDAADHELFVALMNRGQYRAAAAMFVEVSYQARYPLNFPAILAGMKSPDFQADLLAKYESDPEGWDQKWNEVLSAYKADLQFMWGLASFRDETHCAADRLKQGLMQTCEDADAGGMRFLRGVMAYCIQREAAKSKKAEEFYREIVGSFDNLNVESDRRSMVGTFNAGAMGIWFPGE